MTQPGDMTCIELVELVTAYFDGALADGDRARFERHLAECAYCVNYVDQLGQTVRALGRLPAESISEDARRELLEAFRDWKAAS